MRCAGCKRKLPKRVVKIAKSLGIIKVVGRCCCPKAHFLIIGNKFLEAIQKINKKHGKTLRKLKD